MAKNTWGGGHLVDSGGADNLSATFTSQTITLDANDGLSLEVMIDQTVEGTKTAVGTISVEMSNSGINWIAVPISGANTTIAVTSGTDLKVLLSLTTVARFARFLFTRTSGNAICDVYTYVNRTR